VSVIKSDAPRTASEAEKQRVTKWVRKYQERYYLHIVNIDLLFHGYAADDTERKPYPEPECPAQIDCELVETYHKATLNIYPCFFDDDHQDQEFTIAHELAHIVTHRLSAMIERQRAGQLVSWGEARIADEATTDHIARVTMFGGDAEWSERPIKKITARR